ncbi:MAG TPA: response regulator [Gemmatimonadales bacterium]|jgi:two-component system cell cycle sensor histidine kinase/response regulator CckA|nr:response regulator [Gemmatimonadales bacterium]
MTEAKRLRILVVEDEDHVRAVLRLALEQQGCEVVTAEDGVEGLDAVDLQPFDVVVADVHMPRRDGIWLWQQAVAVRPELGGHFLFISGQDFPEKDHGSEREFFLAKPFTMTQLWTMIATITKVER